MRSLAPQGVEADARTPTVQEWRFALERQLGPRAAALDYLVALGTHETLPRP